jgi:microcin C transport system substrate-binding protein
MRPPRQDAMMRVTPKDSRRSALRLILGCLCAAVMLAAAPSGATETSPTRTHGLSAFGVLKYAADFRHFDYVNPDAPIGGRLSMIGTAGLITFNSFNGYILKGDPAQGLDLLFDSLMTRALDEPDAVYALVAHSAEVAPDRSAVTFFMRPEARFADGTPLTAADVVFSFDILRSDGHPNYGMILADVLKAEALDAHTVRFSFSGQNHRDLPQTVATLPIFSAAYYADRPFSETTLEPPLGSGPYEIADFRQGRFVTLRRRDDYWGWDLPVNRGRFNFAELRYEYFRDRTAEFEALKAGVFDLREEFTARTWAMEYDIPQVRSGRMVRAELPDGRMAGAQGFFLNMRRTKFADVRVRRALDLAFDFEWTNINLFHSAYKRTESYFEGSDLKATGEPSPDELALLEPFRDSLPTEVFGPAYVPPVTDGSGQDRRLLREASSLLSAAGWDIRDGKRINAETGEQLSIDFLIFAPDFERVIAPYVRNLARLGINARIVRVDPAQYEERVKDFDFDVTVRRYALAAIPGPQIRNYWGSAAAETKGSANLAGIRSPVIDALIEKVLAAQDFDTMRTATRALDRVLRASHFWVPQWFKGTHTIAFWDKFSWPETKPLYDRGIIQTWWYDEQKAARLEAMR